jgi:hypothetical protein
VPAFALQVVLRSSGESLSRLKHLLAAFHHDVEECLISQTRYTRSAFHPPELVGCPRTVRYHEELVRAEGHTRWRRWVAVPRRPRSRLRSRLDLASRRPHLEDRRRDLAAIPQVLAAFVLMLTYFLYFCILVSLGKPYFDNHRTCALPPLDLASTSPRPRLDLASTSPGASFSTSRAPRAARSTAAPTAPTARTAAPTGRSSG